MRHRIRFGMVVLVAHAVMACGQEDASPEAGDTAESGESEINGTASADVLTKEDDGKTVSVGAGNDVVVELPSTQVERAWGYAWRVVSTDKNFGHPATTELGNDVARFVWKTRGPLSLIGEHAVKMELRRPPLGSGLPHEESSDKPGIGTFSFKVKIVRSACPELMPPGPTFCGGGTIGTRENAYGCTVFTCGYGTNGEE